MNIEWQGVPARRQQMMPRPQKGLSLVSQPKRKLVQKDYKVMELHVNREYKLNNSYDGLIFCVLYVCGLKKIKSRLDMSLASCLDIISVLVFFKDVNWLRYTKTCSRILTFLSCLILVLILSLKANKKAII